MKTNLQKLTQLGLLTAASLMLYIFESLLPMPFPIPGIKLGLANLVTLIALKRFSKRDTLLMLLCRILLSCFFFSQAIGFLYSLAGGLLCLLVMSSIDLLLRGKALPVTSIFGALSHNLAQLTVAFFMTSVPGVFVYLPFLMISGILTGLFIGLCAHFSLKYLPKVG